MRKVILMILLTIVSSNAMAGWVKIGEDKEQIGYADLASIYRDGNLVKMWRLFDGKPPFPPLLRSIKSQDEYDCKKKQWRPLNVSWFSKNMGLGDLVGNYVEPTPWQPVPHDSIDENMWKVACGKK